MQIVLEEECKNFQFLIIIDFYAPFLGESVHKSSIHDA